MNNIQLVAFDLFGVIIEEGHLVRNVLRPLLPSGHAQARVKPLYNDYNLARIDEQAFWSGLGIEDFAEIRRAFLDAFRLDPDYAEILEALAARYRLAILSNLPADWADALVARFDLARDFAPILFSGHCRHKKPNPAIYRLLIGQSALPSRQILFIDDRLENLETASHEGMRTVYLQRETLQHRFQPDHRIDRLGQLIEILRDGV
jgi:putative hydrolase of the HAD superfamily